MIGCCTSLDGKKQKSMQKPLVYGKLCLLQTVTAGKLGDFVLDNEEAKTST